MKSVVLFALLAIGIVSGARAQSMVPVLPPPIRLPPPIVLPPPGGPCGFRSCLPVPVPLPRPMPLPCDDGRRCPSPRAQ